MPITRRFLVASSFSRLVRKERGTEVVTEGHFPTHSGRHSHVRIENGRSYLVLTCSGEGDEASEDWTELPPVHANSLLNVCRGKVMFERCRLPLDEREAYVDHFTKPGVLDLVSVQFATEADAKAFVAPLWFGEEITNKQSYANRALALSGSPPVSETPLSDTALHALLDIVEGSRPDHRPDQSGNAVEPPVGRVGTPEMMRRLGIVPKASGVRFGRADTVAAVNDSSARTIPNEPPAQPQNNDERLSQVIDGLSEALSANSR